MKRPRTEAPADLVGRPVTDLDTPVALVDLDLFELNAVEIQQFLAAHGKTWRPHAKAHKSPRLAGLQLDRGAVGITCAKVSEAEVMVANGVTEVLIANEPATPDKWRRVAALQRTAHVIACVDDDTHVRWAAQAATAAGVTIPLFVEVEVGMRRAGVTSPEAAVRLADRIGRTPGVRLAGVMGYEGHLPAVWPWAEKVSRCAEALSALLDVVTAMRAAGHAVEIVSSGGTGTFHATADIADLTECQAGGGCLMDRFYREDCHVDLAPALTLLTATISVAQPGRAIVDAGFKALGRLSGFPLPRVAGSSGLDVIALSAEHGILSAESGAPVAGRAAIGVGDRIQLIPGYSDAMLVLHDHLVGHRDGVVTEVIPLLARGCVT